MPDKKTAAAASSPRSRRRKKFISGSYELAKRVNECKKLLCRLKGKKSLTPAMERMIEKLKKPRV